MSLIEINGLRKEYQDGETTVKALRGVSLTFAEAEFAAIAGPSGSGKTTLLNLIGGIDGATEGSVSIDGCDLAGMTKGQLHQFRLRAIGFVFQAYNLIPVLTARENVEFTMLLQGVSAPERKQRALAMLDSVGLGDYANRKPTAMSGGQQQRVAVARAIVTKPNVILADEPTANVDSETGANLLDIMKKLNKDHGTTFIFSTHDPMVMDYSRRLVRLHDGNVESDEVRRED